MRRLATPLVALAVQILAATAAVAQYDPPAHMELELLPVAPGEGVLLAVDSAIVERAAEAAQLTLDAVFRVDPNMRCYFERQGEGKHGDPSIVEYELGMPGSISTAPSVLDYRIGNRDIYIGMGMTSPNEFGFAEYQVISFLDAAPTVELLDSFTLPDQYCSGMYVLDLNNDDVLELACPWMTGAGGGGGIEVRAVVPTGGLAYFGDDELASSIWSMHGTIGLLDWDHDGSWEIEITAPLLCTACGYIVKSLVTFDNISFNWVDAEERFPDYYSPQLEFYRELYKSVQGLQSDPEAYRHRVDEWSPYGAQISGEWVSLSPFINEDGYIDQSWVDTLADFVAN